MAVNKTIAVVEQWLQGANDHILTVGVDGSLVTVSIEGMEHSGSVNDLAAELEEEQSGGRESVKL